MRMQLSIFLAVYSSKKEEYVFPWLGVRQCGDLS